VGFEGRFMNTGTLVGAVLIVWAVICLWPLLEAVYFILFGWRKDFVIFAIVSVGVFRILRGTYRFFF
jgi:hypothetical protein